MAERAPAVEWRFLADRNVGGIVRWLRMLGWDAVFAPEEEDHQLLARARQEGRILVTRDRRLFAEAPYRVFLLHSQDPLEQTAELTAFFRLWQPARQGARCLTCGETLVRREPDESVPPRVRQYYEEFWYCPRCARFFWKGSHWARIQRKLQRIRTLTTRLTGLPEIRDQP